MDRSEIIPTSLIIASLLLLIIFTLAIVIDFNNYQNPEVNLDKVKVGEYFKLNGVIKSYIGETIVKDLICGKGCITTHKIKQSYIVLTQNREITVLFNNKQQINSAITITTKVKNNYFDEV